MSPVYYKEGGFPPEDHLDWQRLALSIGPAHSAVAKYDNVIATVSDHINLFMPLHYLEASDSSRIEGINASLFDTLGYEAGQDPESPVLRGDIQEVINCIRAMAEAEKMLQELPLSMRVLREAHRVLMNGARGKHSLPGEIRKNQNWIGPPGSDIEDARFVPISADKLPDALSAWERYVHEKTQDELVQVSVIHAHFEALHPFLDGNGRLGRIIVPLFMWKCGLIRMPVYNISSYLLANRQKYYEFLLSIHKDGDWTSWCEFFLQGIKIQFEKNLETARKIIELGKEIKDELVIHHRPYHVDTAMNWIFKKVLFRSSDLAKKTGIPGPTAHRILNRLVASGYLRKQKNISDRRQVILMLDKYFEILKETQIRQT